MKHLIMASFWYGVALIVATVIAAYTIFFWLLDIMFWIGFKIFG